MASHYSWIVLFSTKAIIHVTTPGQFENTVPVRSEILSRDATFCTDIFVNTTVECLTCFYMIVPYGHIVLDRSMLYVT